MKHKIATTIAILSLGACATSPDRIEATYVSPMTYSNYDCDQISMEMNRVSNRTTELYYKLKDNRSDDQTAGWIGALLFWPALFFIDGDGPETAEFARLKGEYNALEENNVQKKCNISSSSPDEIIENSFELDKATDKAEGTDKAPSEGRIRELLDL